jgi:putative DNA modification/repair radical SAM protein
MQVEEKLEILTDSAKYDVSCSSSNGNRDTPIGGIGNSHSAGLCHSFAGDGRCISLLKILYSNACIYDCAYCSNRRSNDHKRATFKAREIADMTINFYKRNYIEGLFLSSGIVKSEDHTMEQLIEVARILREEYRFGGYIHLKLIPGSSPELIQQASLLADRVSSNIELPTEKSLKLLAPDKSKSNVLSPFKIVNGFHEHYNKHASMTTQMIVGATPESDYDILNISSALYRKKFLKRVYYSAYIPVNSGDNLPALITKPPLLREHRLYQADWLMRFYGFESSEIVSQEFPDLSLDFDPKLGWALNHLELFPVDINYTDKEFMMRIPGIGITSVHKILRARRHKYLKKDDLKALGVSLKKSQFFLTEQGKYMGNVSIQKEKIEQKLLVKKPSTIAYAQESLFDF